MRQFRYIFKFTKKIIFKRTIVTDWVVHLLLNRKRFLVLNTFENLFFKLLFNNYKESEQFIALVRRYHWVDFDRRGMKLLEWTMLSKYL